MEEEIITTEVVGSSTPTQEELLQQSLYMDNVVATIKLLNLAFGEISGTIDQEDQQVMMTRSRSTGQYFMWISGMCFPLEEARLLLSIPEASRNIVQALDKTINIIEINKFALEPFTRINGKAMPNEKISL